jgi:hypothetical protein
VVLSRHTITNERRSDAVDDSLPPTDEYENGMKAAGSVMKAAGRVMKVRMCLSASCIDARVVANEALLLNVSREGTLKSRVEKSTS